MNSSRDAAGEPIQYGGDISQAVAGDGGSGADVDRDPASAIDHGEALFIAAVVADEYRHATAERELRHESLDRPAFSTGFGQELDNHLAVERFEGAAATQHGAPNEPTACRLERGRLTVMERETAAFVFQHEPTVTLGKVRKQRTDANERRVYRIREYSPVATPPLEAMLARRRTRERREQPVEFIERPPAHQGQSTVEKP
jgi:hypothetical protein